MPMVCKADASHDWFHSMQQVRAAALSLTAASGSPQTWRRQPLCSWPSGPSGAVTPPSFCNLAQSYNLATDVSLCTGAFMEQQAAAEWGWRLVPSLALSHPGRLDSG